MKNNKTVFYQLVSLSIGLVLAGRLTTPLLLAKEASPSSSSAIPQEKVKAKIKERLEKVVDENLDKIKGVVAQRRPNKIYAFNGLIISLNEGLITLKTRYAGEKKIKIDPQAVILKIQPGQSKKEIKEKELQTNDFLIAMGVKEKENLLVKRLIVTPQPLSTLNQRKVLFGRITEIDDKKITFEDKEGKPTTITVSSQTEIKIAGLEKKKQNLENIQIADQLAAIVTVNKNNQFKAVKTLLVIPGQANPAAKENEIEATPSASPA